VVVDDVRIVCPLGLEISNVEVDEEFTLEVRVRVFRIERERVDVSDASGGRSLPGALRLDLIAVPVDGWPSPEELRPGTILSPDEWQQGKG
jgi:hypothetical protein